MRDTFKVRDWHLGLAAAINAMVPEMRKRTGKKPLHDVIATSTAIISVEQIEQAIYVIHGQRVMLDKDLAAFYGVQTKRLNEQVRRNTARFPSDFVFQLSKSERNEVVANCDHLAQLKYSPTLPYAFTEHGAIMAATVLKSGRAVQMSLLVVRAFVRLRHILAEHRELARRVEALEREFTKKTDEHERHICRIYQILDELMNPTVPPKKRRIGFVG